MKGGDTEWPSGPEVNAHPEKRAAESPAKGAAVQEVDKQWSRLRSFERLLMRSLDVIHTAAHLGIISVSFSGGKDSTVLLDLCRRCQRECRAVFFDSGIELESTMTIVEALGVEIETPELSMLEMCRRGGYWGREPDDPDRPGYDFKTVLISEPSGRWMARSGCSVIAMGLRAEESGGRAKRAATFGPLAFVRSLGHHVLCPLQDWEVSDIWAYIASNGLRYNAAYDRMAEAGIPRREQRIGTLLGGSADTRGRFVALKRAEPEMFNRLAAEFPMLRAYA